jgi:hypothetical protein
LIAQESGSPELTERVEEYIHWLKGDSVRAPAQAGKA